MYPPLTIECFRPLSEIENRLAYRDTDRHIYHELDNKMIRLIIG